MESAASFIELRRSTEADGAYLYRLVEQTMRGYTEATWGAFREAEVREKMRAAAAEGRFSLIHAHGELVGAVWVERHATHLQLEQLFIASEHQGKGVGTAIVRGVLAEAAALGVPVRLRVLAVNPARRLYERLGFVVTSRTPERLFLEHHA